MNSNPLLSELNTILSESRNPDTLNIDLLSTDAILQKINEEDQKVALAIKPALKNIGIAVDTIVEAIKNKGRLIYFGAGTSGRLGILDAVECVPTFSIEKDIVIGIIAGGEKAIKVAVEGAEDDQEAAIEDLKAINFNAKDVLVGIAASGRTPYVLSGLKYAQQIGAKSVAVSCNPNSAIGKAADVDICAAVGPEILTGSTRMKSGTAQKLILNMLSTASMIKIGKTYQNLMVDVHASNKKLYARALLIVMQATDCDEKIATDALLAAGNEAKVAIMMILTDVKATDAITFLKQNDGFLRAAVESKGAVT
ncbi:N-acetylmuramic acid 6-phosphate etherase [Paraglaciecola psychrophila]|uniref:N-acetylmuramic acid 6-phosphate etherase n=1 Tax=Paraglaciecola psychrophila 170 TaxID=1129794 RepID=K7A7R7_9ALTE|nr:N-acetylmuramic acid 6-phosphate etherase [Paraglaciecola psychrophila]AGH46424.1 glucokinase regulatory-like protein [Paraglaciecola psychrophila 170]GAC38342.1 N-acetylmuramic acid 6-phosphate etherase 2 [Paraglaciecola psychrophila 170]